MYSKQIANWSEWSQSSKWSRNWDWDWDYDLSNYDWSSFFEDDERRLDVFDTLDELKDAIPEELYTSIAKYMGGEDVEILDI